MWDQNTWALIFSSSHRSRQALFFRFIIIMKNFALVQGAFLFHFGGSEAKEKPELQKELKRKTKTTGKTAQNDQRDTYLLCKPSFSVLEGKPQKYILRNGTVIFVSIYIQRHTGTYLYIHIYVYSQPLSKPRTQRPSSQRRICNLKTEVLFKMASLKSFSIW